MKIFRKGPLAAVVMKELVTQLPNLIGLAGLMNVALLSVLLVIATSEEYGPKMTEWVLRPYWQGWMSPYSSDLFVFAFFFLFIGLDLFAVEWRQRTAVWLRSFPLVDGAVAAIKLTVGWAVVLLSVLSMVPAQALAVWLLGGDVSILQPLAAAPVAALLALPWLLLGCAISGFTSRPSLLIPFGLAVWYGLSWAGSLEPFKSLLKVVAGESTLRLVAVHLIVATVLGSWVIRAETRRQVA